MEGTSLKILTHILHSIFTWPSKFNNSSIRCKAEVKMETKCRPESNHEIKRRHPIIYLFLLPCIILMVLWEHEQGHQYSATPLGTFGTLNPESLICHGFPAVPIEPAEKLILLILAKSPVSKTCVIHIENLLSRDRPLSLGHGEEFGNWFCQTMFLENYIP